MNAQHPAGSVPAADPPDDLAALLNTLADGTLGDTEELRLRAILEGSPAARQAFREFATLHAGLYWDYATLLTPGLPPLNDTRSGETRSGETRPNETTPDNAGPGHSLRRTAAMLAAAAMAVASAVAVWLFLISPARPLVDQGLATVTQARFLLPSDPTNSLAVGQSLAAGRVTLLGGAIELTLSSGVVITLEGPGDIDLQGELQAFLHSGNATVRMPKGMNGFRLATPSTDVLDLGTEFAVMAGGGLQVRLSTDRSLGWPAAGNAPCYCEQRKTAPTAAEIEVAENPRLSHLTMWYHAASGTPCLAINHGAEDSRRQDRGGLPRARRDGALDGRP
jgi:hypothetical protein